MKKLTILSGLVATACALFLLATAASGYWQSRDHTSTSGLSRGAGGFVLTIEPGGAQIVCNDVRDTWTIQTETKQEPTTKGQHLQIEATFEGKVVEKTQSKNCEDKVGGQVLPVFANFQVKQPPPHSTTGLSARLDEDVIIKQEAACTITLPSKENANLTKVKAANNTKESSVELVPEVKGIVAKVSGAGCSVAGLKNSSKAEFLLVKGATDKEEGLEII